MNALAIPVRTLIFWWKPLSFSVINGEKAAFNTPVFAQKRERTLDMLIKNVYQDYMPEISKNNMINRRAFSDVIPDSLQHGSRRKEEARHLEFVRIGQVCRCSSTNEATGRVVWMVTLLNQHILECVMYDECLFITSCKYHNKDE
jgi:hypothetical protein